MGIGRHPISHEFALFCTSLCVYKYNLIDISGFTLNGSGFKMMGMLQAVDNTLFSDRGELKSC
jgi:hypothetical protein